VISIGTGKFNVDITEINVNGESADRNGNNFYIAAECGVNSVSIDVTADMYAAVTINGAAQNPYTANLANYGNNVFTITVTAQNGDSQTYTLTVHKPLPFDQIVQMRWNNTLTVINNPANNGGYTFVSYKWFRNGQQIGTGQSLSAGTNGEPLPAGEYYVEATTASGAIIRTCANSISVNRMEIKAYPNPVSPSQTLYIDADIDEALLQGAVIEIYNFSGNRIAQLPVLGRLTPISINYATGNYIFIFKGKDGLRKDIKVVVAPNN
jgi:hypothetical protein